MNKWEEGLPLLERGFRECQERYLTSPMKEMLAYHFASGGKRLRPTLTYAAGISYANKKGKKVNIDHFTPYALAVELTHNATLIHDDLQDGDRTRRGTETLWVKYSAAQAINCGDAWFFVPQLLIQDSDYSPEMKLDLLAVLQRKTLAVIQGQADEFALKEKFFREEDISISQYLSMVEGKTSALFSMPLLGGAKIVGATPLEQRALEESALHLGRAFQIQDDLLDLWGEKGREQVGSDIAEGKLSYPMVLAFSVLKKGSQERKKLEQILKAPREKTSAEDILWSIELMEKIGVKELAKKDFDKSIKDAQTPSLWEEVIQYLSGWLTDKVSKF